MKAKRIILFFLLLSALIPQAWAADFGEDEDYLGQVVEDYENADNIAAMINTINNETLDCMELDYFSYGVAVYNETQVREHDLYGDDLIVEVNFAIVNNDELRESQMVATRYGDGHAFITVNREWLDNKYIRFRWYCYRTYGTVQIHYFRVYDGDYDRSSNIDFPSGADIPTKGNGLLYSYSSDIWNSWVVKDFLIDTSGGTEENATIFFRFHDGWFDNNIGIYVDWIEFNGGAGGIDNLFTINYDDSTPLTMEVTGTQGDYGYCETPEFVYEGYFSNGNYYTTEILDGDKALNLMYNATIPASTGITMELSKDNATWVNHNDQAGYEELVAGFESIDLRDLNTSIIYVRVNMTSDGSDTPRMWQERFVTVTTIGLFPGLAIGISLLIIGAIYALEKRR